MIYFKVNDFDKLQHYKDRSPPWIKQYNADLEDYTLASLEDKDKAHLFAIRLLASRNHNRIPYDAVFVAGKINARSPVDLDLLVEKGFLSKINDINNASNPIAEVGLFASTEERREEHIINKAPEISNEVEEGFSKFWENHPVKVDKEKAKEIYYLHIIGGVEVKDITEGQAHYIKHKPEKQEWTNPVNWLLKKRWTARYVEEKKVASAEITKDQQQKIDILADLKKETDESDYTKNIITAFTSQFGVAPYNSWLRPCAIKKENNQFLIIAPSRFIQGWILSNFFRDICTMMQKLGYSEEIHCLNIENYLTKTKEIK